ncbi:type IV pilus assembly protein PilF [Gammaproteobacteria bacterium]
MVVTFSKNLGFVSSDKACIVFTMNKSEFFRIKFLLIVFTSLFFLIGCSLTANQKYNTEAANINAKLGLAYLQQNNIELAKNKLLIAYEQAPIDAKVNEALGYFFCVTGEPVLAEKYYLYAIKRGTEKGSVWHNYGLFLYRQNRYREALKYFLLAAKDINYLFVAKAYADASDAALKLGQNNLAQQYRKDAVMHDPHLLDRTHKNLF